MTREEQVKRYAPEVFGIITPITKAFMDGIKFADEHPLNPWTSVVDSLPQESKKYKGCLSDTVFVMTNKNDGTSARYDHATKTWCPAKILQGSITHWMPIPEV